MKFILLFVLFTISLAQNDGCSVYADAEQTKCKYCKSGYGYNAATQNCTICPKAQFSPGGQSVCKSCIEYSSCAKIQDETERETTCPYFSDEEGSAQCRYCPLGKYVDVTHESCYECPGYCEECYGGKKTGKCLRCQGGYGIDPVYGTCVKCDAKKGLYSDGTTRCLSVKNNSVFLYSFNEEDGGQYKYNYCAENCKICNGNMCAQCLKGYSLNLYTNTCEGGATTGADTITSESPDCADGTWIRFYCGL